VVNIKPQSGSKFYGLSMFVRAGGSIISIGENCRFRSRTTSNLIGINHKCIISTLDKNAKLIIGDNCGFSGTTIGCFKEITFGKNVNCGANTLITDSDWHPNDPRSGEAKVVNIGNNVWLGYGVIVLKGLRIGEKSVIRVGSVVTKSIPANVIAGGNHCKVLSAFGNDE
jgi:acetyltransferase-like isoleucine patch superfamily enzyme